MHPQPKKSLGQNFLVDKNIQKKIIANCNLKKTDTVLEIGAGRGELTRLITERVAKVYAVEIDPVLCAVLEDKFKGHRKVRIIKKDILKVNLKNYLPKTKKKIKIVGNIPYYITTPIIERLFRARGNIRDIFITVQKEFAERMVAGPGSPEYSAFSCFVQYYTKAKILFVIKKTCFLPRPKVDSCLLHLGVRREPPVKVKNEKLFFRIIRSSFSQRRKTLRNSLKGRVQPEKLAQFFIQYAIDPNTRPERLALTDFAFLANLQSL